MYLDSGVDHVVVIRVDVVDRVRAVYDPLSWVVD